MRGDKPRIRAFRWHDKYMAIDWDSMQSAFDITSQYGDAGLFLRSADRPGIGVKGAIPLDQIRQFTLQSCHKTGLLEVVLEVAYGEGSLSLGVTDQVEEAEHWVADANRLVLQARRQREQNSR